MNRHPCAGLGSTNGRISLSFTPSHTAVQATNRAPGHGRIFKLEPRSQSPSFALKPRRITPLWKLNSDSRQSLPTRALDCPTDARAFCITQYAFPLPSSFSMLARPADTSQYKHSAESDAPTRTALPRTQCASSAQGHLRRCDNSQPYHCRKQK